MLEIASFNARSAIIAANAGASRIELCASYALGGVTPSLPNLQQVRQHTTTPINVMIRPRAGDFVYTDAEFQQMKDDILLFKELASGFVFGILDGEARVDAVRNRELVGLAGGLPCTFHRAIDGVADLEEGVDVVVECGFRSILTSGGGKSAGDGVQRIAEWQARVGDRIDLIAGGGVRSGNVDGLVGRTGVRWVHSAAITEEGEDVDGEEVRRILGVLRQRVEDG